VNLKYFQIFVQVNALYLVPSLFLEMIEIILYTVPHFHCKT